MIERGTRWLVMLAVLAWLGRARPAEAQSSSAQAETLFRQGKRLVAEGKLAEACAAFESSHKLAPAVTTLVNLADCREKNNQLATAWGIFIEVQRELRGGGDSVKALAKVATERAARLEPRLSKLTIAVAADHQVVGLEVRRNDELVDAGAWNQPLPVDGGRYTIVARAPGLDPWSTEVTVQPEGDLQTVEVPALEPPATAAASVPLAETPVPPPPRRDAPPRRSRTLAIVTLAIAGVAIAGSALSGKLAFDKWSEAEALCGNDGRCPDDDQTARANRLADESRARGWWSTGLGAVGVASAAVGVWLLVRPAGASEASARTVQVSPLVDGTRVGLVVGGAL